MAAVVMLNAIALSPSELALEMIRLVGPAVDQAIAEASEPDADPPPDGFPARFERFVGSYDENPWGGEAAVLPWDGGLAILWLPTMYPSEGLTPIEHVDENVFRRTRLDGEPGEEYEFVEDADGTWSACAITATRTPEWGRGW